MRVQTAAQRRLPDGDLPFTLADLRAAVPRHCFEPSTARSLLHLGLDLAGLAALQGLAWWVDHWALWLLLWPLMGLLCWAIFLVAHDCGHGAFSAARWVNTLVGQLVSSPLLVPYHGWRISHRIHHQNVGNLDRDATWFPLTESQRRALPWYARVMRYRLFLLVFPFYLLRNTPGRLGSHFDASGPLFRPCERAAVRSSVLLCGVALTGLVAAGVILGPVAVIKSWLGPYVWFCIWLDMVTYLHHTDASVPWYRGEEWSFLRGALSTIDRSYGPFEMLHHHVGTHVAHHLFAGIPHYHLREATRAIRPILGEHYRSSREPILRSLLATIRACQAVPERGGRVYYQPGGR